MDEEYFRPWGTVTPDYWVNGADRSDVGSAAVAPQQEPLPAEQAPAVPTTAQVGPADVVPTADTTLPPPQLPVASSSSSPAGDGPPVAYLARINSVVAAFAHPGDREGLAAATVEAEALDHEFTAQYGQQHAHTVNVREIRGWLALLAGQPAVAARWYLHTTGLQIALRGADHPDTEGSARRAVHTWQQVKVPAEVVQIGGDLAKVVTAVLGENSDVARFVQARVARRQRQQ